MTLLIYPISGWVWNAGGWFAKMGFTDFAGSSVVHSVGGWASLVAAALVGPRIGKYNTDGTVNAIPGHNLMLGALGVYFMVWMVGVLTRVTISHFRR
jgi:Amt family ammonium transporter